jgi:hypothetical protein
MASRCGFAGPAGIMGACTRRNRPSGRRRSPPAYFRVHLAIQQLPILVARTGDRE